MPDGSARILIVEDEFIIAETLADYLKSIGYVCIGPAANLQSALDLIRTESFDAAVLDARLGGDRIDEAADAIAERGIPFVFTVGEPADIDPARWPGRPVVMKPYSDKDIGQVLAKLLSR